MPEVPPTPHGDSFLPPNRWDGVGVRGDILGVSISGSIRIASEAWGPGVSTSRGNGSLGQAQFGEASRETEELLAETEETWGSGERTWAGEWLLAGTFGVVRLGLEWGVRPGGQGWKSLGLGQSSGCKGPYSNLGWALGWGRGLHSSGNRIQGWGSPLSSMGLWDRVRACSTQLPLSPNTPASFWTKSLQGRGGRICPELSPASPAPGYPPVSSLPGWLGLER